MSNTIKVAVLEDHQSIIDGYTMRLREADNVELVGVASHGEELEMLLALNPHLDVLIMDVSVPISAVDHNSIPILHYVSKLLAGRDGLNILVISMYTQKSLIKALMGVGASGYILKQDSISLRNLAVVVKRIANGGTYFSEEVSQALEEEESNLELSNLTARQLEAISLCAAFPELSTDELAMKANVAKSTFRNLLSETYERLSVHSRGAAVVRAKTLGLIS